MWLTRGKVLVLVDICFTASCYGDFRQRRAMPNTGPAPHPPAASQVQDHGDHDSSHSANSQGSRPSPTENHGADPQENDSSPIRPSSAGSGAGSSRIPSQDPDATPPLVYSPASLQPCSLLRQPPPLTQGAHPFINVATRGPAFATSVDDADRLGYLALSTTTLGDFSAWLGFADTKHTCKRQALGPISTLFMIPFYDTIDFLEVVNKFLDDVIESAEDSFNVELHIQKWRHLLDLLSTEFRQLAATFPSFGDFVCMKRATDQDSDGDSEMIADSVEKEIDRARAKIVTDIERTSQRLDKALQSLMNSLSIAASQRSIAEAEGVSKLTELGKCNYSPPSYEDLLLKVSAFVYIPVTFAAGVFGMNVTEIDSSKTSINGFVILAVMLVVLSYCIRLFMRSSAIATAKQNLMSNVRQSTRTPPGSPVRTRDFLAWGIPGYRVVYSGLMSDELPPGWQLSAFFLFTIAAAYFLPLSSLWSRSELLSSVKSTISIAATIPLVCAMIGYMLYSIQNRLNVFGWRTAEAERLYTILISRYHGTRSHEEWP